MYASSWKGKVGKEVGTGAPSFRPEGVSARGTFAGIAPSGQIIMSGVTTGLAILEQAFTNMPALVSTTKGGPLTAINFRLCKIQGGHRPVDAEYVAQQLKDPCEPDDGSQSESEEWLKSRKEWLDPHEEEDSNGYAGYD